ncbi:hypothetical protein KXS07_36555 [Inquilinus limosus]|uniref:hypothetical protein n=1 Tax=Inquilinus limosus TaxID=171674 RepID=UPI003F18AE7A
MIGQLSKELARLLYGTAPLSGEADLAFGGDAQCEMRIAGASPRQTFSSEPAREHNDAGGGGTGRALEGDHTVAAGTGIIWEGTYRDESKQGTEGDDFLFGEGGDDELMGGKGDDELSGGDGHDLL